MTSLDRMIPTLVHIQTHLDDDLKLEGLARVAGVTPSHFSRSFTATIGESPRAYVERLRLEGAAVLLISRAASVLEIALDSGFQSHETFTRAFSRRFGIAPSRWRHGSASHRATADANDGRRRSLAEELPKGSLSPTTIRTLRSARSRPAPCRPRTTRYRPPFGAECRLRPLAAGSRRKACCSASPTMPPG